MAELLTIKELQEQVRALKKEIALLKGENDRKGLRIGDTFILANLKWTILKALDNGYVCLANSMDVRMQFYPSGNDWEDSGLRKFLNNEFLKTLLGEVGEENILPFERNLISLDGRTEYGTCEDKVSLLSFDEYRKYRDLIPYDDKWWWLLTPWNTCRRKDKRNVITVSPVGEIGSFSCAVRKGIRPVCVFSSEIFK